MKRVLKHTAAAVLLAVAATMLIATPASAARLVTSIETTERMFDCSLSDTSVCTDLGNAPAATSARSYCLVGTKDLIFSVGAANRFGFFPRANLVNKNQNTNCFNGGAAVSVNSNIPLRICANQACPESSGDLALGDPMRGYCRRNDPAGNAWFGVFNGNGQRTGFAPAALLTLPPGTVLPTC